MSKRRIRIDRIAMISESTRAARDGFHSAAKAFLLNEIDLAITFAKVTISTIDPAKSDREGELAEHALQGALRSTANVQLTSHGQEQIFEKIQQLDSLVPHLAARLPMATTRRIKRCLGDFKKWARRQV